MIEQLHRLITEAGPARGILLGIAIGAAMWLIIAAAVLLIFG